MSEEYRIQASYSTRGGLMVNVRHETAEGFIELMEKVAAMGPILDAVGETVNPPKTLNPEEEEATLASVGQAMGGQVVGVTRTCPHGPMVYKDGGSWQAYMCPAQRNDPSRCQPIDAKTGRAWPKK